MFRALSVNNGRPVKASLLSSGSSSTAFATSLFSPDSKHQKKNALSKQKKPGAPEDLATLFRDLIKHKKSLLDMNEPIEIPHIERFEKKLLALLERKKKEKEDKFYLNELFELSREASLEDETEAKKRRATEGSKEG